MRRTTTQPTTRTAGRRGRAGSPVPPDLQDAIGRALEEVTAAREALVGPGDLVGRRAAHARLRHAYLEADRLLREATTLARRHSRWEWTAWRRRLSDLDTARQQHLFAEQDASCILRDCTVQALDTGMAGPAIGELQHGEAARPGAVAAYGVDLESWCLRHDGNPCLAAPGPGPGEPQPSGRVREM